MLNSQRVCFFLILIVGAILRISNLGRESFWLDEYTSVEVASRSLSDIIFSREFDSHTPPFYYLLLHFWLSATSSSEFEVRLLSAIFDIANIALLFRLFFLLFSYREALLAAFLYSISPFAIYYAQEARMYSLLAFEALLLISFAAQLPKLRFVKCIALSAVTAVGLYTHYYFALFATAVSLGVLFYSVDFRKSPFPPRIILVRWFAPMILAGVSFLPWVGIVVQLAKSGGQSFRHFTLSVLPYTGFRFVVGYGIMPLTADLKNNLHHTLIQHALSIGAFSVIFSLAGIYGLLKLLRSHWWRLYLPALLLPPLFALLLSLKAPMFSERYLMVIFPLFVGVLALSPPALSAAVLPFFLAGTLAHFWNPTFGKEQWRDVGKYISGLERRSVIIAPDFAEPIAKHYMRDRNIRRFLGILPTEHSIYLVERGGRPSVVPDFLHAGFTVESTRLFPNENGITVFGMERQLPP